jgi:hypothetical protein
MNGLGPLMQGAWDAFDRARESRLPSLVLPSMPIAWFGDVDAYNRSPLRVVTVGLNPSLAEFPSTDPFRRFPLARAIHGMPRGDADLDVYQASLNAYFHADPYDAWFRQAFEPLLKGLGASYYGGAAATALHTDLCSPVATDPTWSKLRRERDVLRADGVPLWHGLIRALKPHVILASVARAYLAQVEFPMLGSWETRHTIDREQPYLVEGVSIDIGIADPALLIFGRAAQLPFGTVSTTAKREIGEAILESLRAG